MRSMSLSRKHLVSVVAEWLNGVRERESSNLKPGGAVPTAKSRGPSAVAVGSWWRPVSPRRLAALFALLLLALLSAGTRAATASAAVPQLSATYSTIDYPGSASTQVNGIARTGPLGRSIAVVGKYTDIRGGHGFIFSGGVYKTLDVPLMYVQSTQAYGINTRGEIVGTYFNSLGGLVCNFEYSAGTYEALLHGCVSGSTDSLQVHGINAQDDLVGNNYYYSSQNRGFVTAPGYQNNMVEFPYALQTEMFGINSNANPEIVGDYEDANHGYHGAVWKLSPSINGGWRLDYGTSLDVPGTSGDTQARGVNDSGQIVGFFGSHGFLDTNGSFSSVNYPGADQTEALGIDSAQSTVATGSSYQIVGTYWVGQQQHGFIATVGRTPTNL